MSKDKPTFEIGGVFVWADDLFLLLDKEIALSHQ
jgi:hypothetical protein